MKKTVCAVIFQTIFSILAIAEVRLPAVLSSNMVLQQNTKTNLWGWADPAEKIFITTSWNNVTDSVVAGADAKWKMPLATPAAGGPYTITLKGGNTIVLENVMIGEVWVCSGQSNMEWSSYQNLKQIIDEMPNSNNSSLRFFHIPKTTAEHPQDNTPGQWKVSSPESLQGFSAIAYFFGKKLQSELNVAVGLVNASWGGTPAEVWTPATPVYNDVELKKAAEKQNQTPWWPVTPGLTYNAMISPITSHAIAGTIWYQGEGNTGTAGSYGKLFTTMIASWRQAWQNEFPFYYVQIAPFTYGNKNVGALVREQQTQSMSLPKTGMVVITDLVDNVKDIHPQNKKDVADRLANWALAETYKKPGIVYKGPFFKRMEVLKDKVTVYFDNAPNGFIVKGAGKPSEFYIAGADRNFLPAEVKLEKDRIVLSNKQIRNPVAVRFAFSNTAMSNVFSKEGLPIAPFRTDNWEIDTSKE